MFQTNGASYLAVILSLAVTAGVVAGCDSDPAGPLDAQVSASLQDENANSQTVALASFLPRQDTAGFSGTFDANARVEISADGETWVDLGDSRQVSVQLQSTGDQTTVHSQVTVPADVYVAVRLVIEGASAEIDAGSTIGVFTLDADVTLSIGAGGEIIIEREFEQSIQLSAGSHLSILFDLNSETWVTASTVESGTVASSDIQAAVAMQTEVDS